MVVSNCGGVECVVARVAWELNDAGAAQAAVVSVGVCGSDQSQ